MIGAAVGVRYLRQVAKGTIVPDKDRIRAAESLIKRQYGTALIAIELPAEPVDLPHGLITKAALIEASGAPVYQPVDQDDSTYSSACFSPPPPMDLALAWPLPLPKEQQCLMT